MPQLSQVCTQGGLCDQLQSKTELEDTQAQDRKAGIVRRKHLEEISDDEDTHWDPGKGTGCLICEGYFARFAHWTMSQLLLVL